VQFYRAETAAMYPHACLCGNTAGPFVDTLMERPQPGGIARIYLCERCIADAVRCHGGYVEKQLYDDALLAVKQTDGEIAGLRAELAIANDPASKVVDLKTAVQLAGELAQVIDLDAERKKRRPAQTSTKHRAG
jgi:hypothetical protein